MRLKKFFTKRLTFPQTSRQHGKLCDPNSGEFPNLKYWQARRDSNPQPAVLETAALPIGATGLSVFAVGVGSNSTAGMMPPPCGRLVAWQNKRTTPIDRRQRVRLAVTVGSPPEMMYADRTKSGSAQQDC